MQDLIPDFVDYARRVPLAESGVQAFYARVSQLGDLDQRIELLDEAERGRAQRFHFERDRRTFVAAHILLRSLLSAYAPPAARSLRFRHNEFGKPFLDGPASTACFNLSHSGEHILLAVTRNAGIGADIELVRSDFPCLEIATNYFTDGEAEMMRPLSRERQTAMFFRAWARKEAYLKARGVGLSLPLNGFDMSTDLRPTSEITSQEDGERWTIWDVPAARECSAAVVVSGWGRALHLYPNTEAN